MPSHQLLTSGSLRLLETALFEHIKREKHGDPFQPVVVLCGSGFLGHYLSREMVRRGFPHLGISFLTFNGLAEMLARRSLLEKNLALVPEGGKTLVAGRVVRRLPPQSYFAGVQDQPHLPQVMAVTFTDIEDSCIDFPAVARKASYKSPASRRKIAELVRLYEQYGAEFDDQSSGENANQEAGNGKRETGNGRLLSEARLLAEAGQQAARFAPLFATGKLLVYGFYELTGAQYELLAQLVAQVETTAFLLFESGDERLAAAQKLRTWWMSKAAGKHHLEQDAPANNLSVLRANVFRDAGAAHEDDGTFRVLSCPHETAEAREIAREAVRLKRDAGIPFHEMAVLARDAASYLPLLASVFTQVGIPYYLREGLPLSQVAAGRSILAALRLPEGEYTRVKVMQWLTSGALDPRALDADGSIAAVSLWDRISAEAGIVAGEAQWRERLQQQLANYCARLEAAGEERKPALQYRIEQAENLASFMERLFAAGNEWRGQQTWTTLADASATFLRRFCPVNREREQVEDMLFSLRHLDHFGQRVTLEEFAAAATAALGNRSVHVGTLQQTGVHLLSLSAARHTRFRVVFVPGMTEGHFPMAGRQDPILLDEERRALSANSGLSLPLKSLRPQEENLLFLLALEAAQERLVLTTARRDAVSGTERIPSHFLLAALETLAGRTISWEELNQGTAVSRFPFPVSSEKTQQLTFAFSRETGNGKRETALPWVVFLRSAGLLTHQASSALDAREFDLGKIRTCLDSAHPESSRYLERLSPNFARAVEAERAPAATPGLTVYEGMLSTPECRRALAELFSPERVYSATALERYASCPYHFFLNDVLRLKELEEPSSEDELAAQEKGQLIHAILREFYSRMKAQKKLPLAAEHMEAYRQALKNSAEWPVAAGQKGGRTLQQELILEDLERYLLAEMERNEDWLPDDFERSFGQENQSSFALALVRQSIKLRGQIDRLDLSPDRRALRVVDYKSGGRRHNLKVDLAGGAALQLPLYLFAAASLYPNIDLGQSTAEYCHVTRAGEWRSCTFSGADLLQKQQDLREILETIVNGAREGIFPRCPGGKGALACDSCEYAAIGNPRRQAIEKRNQDDPRLDAFRRMRTKL
jgi:ATP-dependent helicase/DNAse subunit B